MAKNKKLNILKRAKYVKMCFKNADCENIYSDLSLCKIEALFNREIIIEGCKKVCEYSDTRITFTVNHGGVIIDGEHLNIYSFENGNATVRGKITSLSFAC